ncbi:MAG: DUF1616 domain-containing protein [Methanothrix sp.]
MRLAWPPPRHLSASVLIPVAALALIHLSPTSYQEMLSAILLVLIFLIPGYLAVLWAHPGRDDISVPRRAALSFAASLILAGLVSLMLNATPRGLESSSLATILSLLAIFLTLVAYIRWSDLPRNRRFLLRPKSKWRQIPAKSQRVSRNAASKGPALALFLSLFFIAALALTFGPYHISLDGISSGLQGLPSIAESGEDGGISARSLSEGPSNNLSAGVSESHEGQSLIAGYAGMNSTKLDNESADVASNATKNATSNAIDNASVKSSSPISRPTFFGGGGGGGGSESSSPEISKKSRAKETAPQAIDEAEDAADAPAAADASAAETSENKNESIAVAETSNISSTLSPVDLMGNATMNNSIENLSSDENLSSELGAMPYSATMDNETNQNDTDQTNYANDTALPSAALIPLKDQESSAENLQQEPSSELSASSPPQNLSPGNESVAPDETGLQTATGQQMNQSNLSDTGESIEEINATATMSSDENQTQADDSSNANLPPFLQALISDKTSPQPPGTSIFWRAEASDHEGDRIFYKFLLDGQQATGWSRIASWNWITSGLPSGDHQITVLIRAEDADESSYDDMMNASFSLRSPNQAPVLKSLNSDRTSPEEIGGRMVWTASAADPDNDTIYYKFLKNGQEAAGWSTSDSWAWDTSSEDAGEYRISVMVRDALHEPESSFDSLLEETFTLILPNFIPVISSLDPDRHSPQPQGSIITWNAAAIDPEADPISFKFLVDGIDVSEWSGSSSWAWDTSSFQPGEHVVKSLVRDGKHAPVDSFDSFKDASFNISAANHPPILTDLTSDIASPQAQGASVTWTAQAQDSDGDPIFYKFQLDGRDMTGWSNSPTWTWSSGGQSIGNHRIRALARDTLHAPESSYDSIKESTFSLVSEIDMQIESLQKNR